jgi:hypothetical protein
MAISERRARQPGFEAFLTVALIPGCGNVEVRIVDNGDGREA